MPMIDSSPTTPLVLRAEFPLLDEAQLAADGRITSNPAQYVRRPRVHPTTQRGTDRGELASFRYTAERTSPIHAALAVLLGLNGLRISEACGANVENLGFERGHRTLQIIGKGNKPATIPLVPRTGRTLDLAIGERIEGPVLVRTDSRRLDTRTAYRWARSIGTRAGLDHVHPHMLRAAFIMAALDAGVPLRDVQIAARHSDPLSVKLLKHGTLKVYPGYPHGAFTIHHDVINPDLLEFIRS